MTGKNDANPVTHFGRQVRKERVARGWSLDELASRTGIAAGHWSRIETGKRPPTENIALACDAVFPERKGYFLEYYEESKTWMPAGFRDWPEYENKAARIWDWWPSVASGLLQTEEYARAHLSTYPMTTAEAVSARLANRMERQRRVLMRDDPPSAWFIVDHTALYRLTGSPEVMAGQCRRLLEIAAMPNVTMQVLPAVTHPATPSGFMIADNAAYAEHVAGGFTYTDEQTLARLARLFDTLRAECYRASESLAIVRKAEEIWTGESQASAAPTAAHA